ncbi:hypothetical protein H4Q26_014949 [Puccinia striiformis f. sp. tritici PST-130]|nr:hypothetical protein H4Q26_014949 [Puccinia striiformis f. sp. tritici PST-130]
MSDKNTKPTTRPLTCRGDWELLEDSVSHIKLGQQYGRITTRSFYSSHTNDPVDYEVNLSTNSSMLNMLDEKYIYSIPGKIIIPNSKCQPTMTYFHERVTKICSKSHRIDDSTNKTTVAGIALITPAQGGPGGQFQRGTPNPSPDARGRRLITYSGIEEPQASTSNTTLDNGIVQESTNTADVAGAETLDEPFVKMTKCWAMTSP